MKNLFGTVEYKGKEYQLYNQAVAENYGTEEQVRYYAGATDADGNKYEVAWNTTEGWDLSQELDNLQTDSHLSPQEEERLAELEKMQGLPDVSDESNACDWDSPIKVTLQ